MYLTDEKNMQRLTLSTWEVKLDLEFSFSISAMVPHFCKSKLAKYSKWHKLIIYFGSDSILGIMLRKYFNVIKYFKKDHNITIGKIGNNVKVHRKRTVFGIWNYCTIMRSLNTN